MASMYPVGSNGASQAILDARELADQLAAQTSIDAALAAYEAERRGRILRDQAERIIESFANLEIEIVPQAWGEMLPLARQYGRSAYDAAYLILAERLAEKLITGDERLYNAVKGKLDWVVWMGDYQDE